MTMNGDVPAELGEIVRARDVRYEVSPEYGLLKHQSVPIGYEIELSAATDCDDHDEMPGCERCDRVFLDLNRVAQWIIERAGAERADVESFDSAWRSTSSSVSRRRIVLRIRLTRHSGFEKTLDEHEQSQLASIESALAKLGVERGSARSRG
jgi:hypothetical protein